MHLITNQALLPMVFIKTYSDELLGLKYHNVSEFPLLYKYIDAEQSLSLQLHPDDETAQQLENSLIGKTEAWYVIDCPEKKIIVGLPDNIQQNEAAEAIKNGKINKIINYASIDAGSFISIPAGSPHAILKKTLLAEIQQPCDITYRIFDWGRNDTNRKINFLNAAAALKKTELKELFLKPVIIRACKSYEHTLFCNKQHFIFQKITILKKYNLDIENNFLILSNIGGTAKIKYGVKVSIDFLKGETILIPASLDKLEITKIHDENPEILIISSIK